MNVFVNEGNIYDRKGNEIVPDEKGIVCLEIDNKPRRFVKDKLVNYLLQSGRAIAPPKIKVKRTIVAESAKPKMQKGKYPRAGKLRGKYNYTKPYVRTKQTPRTGDKIIAEKDGAKVNFISITACAKAIGISKSNLSKIMRGEHTNHTGYNFSYS